MKNIIMKNNLYLITGLGLITTIYTVINWSTMPFLQRMVGIFFFGIVLHLWEEGKFPGGFTDMITAKFNFTAKNQHFGESITTIYVLFITFIPFFFPDLTFLALAPILLGFLEVLAHLVASKMYDKSRFYSPGLITAAFVLLPISIYTTFYVINQTLVEPMAWVLALLYMVIGLITAQQYVVRSSGMKYSEFIANVRKTILTKN